MIPIRNYRSYPNGRAPAAITSQRRPSKVWKTVRFRQAGLRWKRVGNGL